MPYFPKKSKIFFQIVNKEAVKTNLNNIFTHIPYGLRQRYRLVFSV
ncbi:hypothetical protein GY50_1131 [Dehalococcoides mccartyi GY50]|nr:hypothetical protein GY50_1131 [Dehalococcoides mccartyi GY50]